MVKHRQGKQIRRCHVETASNALGDTLAFNEQFVYDKQGLSKTVLHFLDEHHSVTGWIADLG